MISIRKNNQRGHFENSWLNSHHTFSFGDYYDPQHMGVSLLRVINEDTIQPNSGFPTRAHNNMEIISYVLSGELTHKDNLGNGSTIRPGDVQRMSAGSGVTHSEFNPSATEETHFLQIWLLPTRQNHEPGYEQKHFSYAQRSNQLTLLASPDGREGSIVVNSNALMYGSVLAKDQSFNYPIAGNRMVYLHVASGQVQMNGTTLYAGDGATISLQTIHLTGENKAECLLFDLPKNDGPSV